MGACGSVRAAAVAGWLQLRRAPRWTGPNAASSPGRRTHAAPPSLLCDMYMRFHNLTPMCFQVVFPAPRACCKRLLLTRAGTPTNTRIPAMRLFLSLHVLLSSFLLHSSSAMSMSAGCTQLYVACKHVHSRESSSWPAQKQNSGKAGAGTAAAAVGPTVPDASPGDRHWAAVVVPSHSSQALSASRTALGAGACWPPCASVDRQAVEGPCACSRCRAAPENYAASSSGPELHELTACRFYTPAAATAAAARRSPLLSARLCCGMPEAHSQPALPNACRRK